MLFGKHVNGYYIKYWYMFLFGVLALFLVDIVQLFIPDQIATIIDLVKEENLTFKDINYFLVIMIIITICMFIGRFIWRICIFGVGIRIEDDIRRKMFQHMETLDHTYFAKNKTGAQMALYTNDLQVVKDCFTSGTIMLIDALLLGGLSFYKMLKLDVLLTIISASPLLLFAVFGTIISKVIGKKWEERQKAYDKMSDFSQENFSGLSVVKAFVREKSELLEFKKVNKENEEKNINFYKFMVMMNVVINSVVSLIMVIIICYGSYLVKEDIGNLVNPFTLGSLTKFISYFLILIWPISALAQIINLRAEGKTSLKRISVLLDENSKIIEPTNPVMKEITGNIRFDHLTFNYPDSDTPVLTDVSFSLNKGESLGIIGSTGSGKTTIVDILTRVYNVERNKVFIDDFDIMDYRVKDIRQAISYVPQDNFLFSTSIKSNISFSLDVEPISSIIDAADFAGVRRDIESFSNSYDTVLGERGVTLSGGQKQRISIARSIIKDSKILIFDDALSAVDTKTEARILANIKSVQGKKSIIMIAHRISTVKNLDKIIVLKEGKIIACGTHEELYMNSLDYRHLVDMQKLDDYGNGDE